MGVRKITPIIESGVFTFYKCISDSEKFIAKTLSPDYRIEKNYSILEIEFERLSEIRHPNILCTSEFTEIPELGKCIIMEGFNVEPLEDILQDHLTPKLLTNIQYNLIDTIAFLQENDIPHKLEYNNLMIDRESGILKIIITDSTDEQPEKNDIMFFGTILRLVLKKIPGKNNRLNKIADNCVNGEYQNIGDLQLDLEKYSSNSIYIPVILLLSLLIGILYWLNKL